jgi:hypothetical protein
MTINEEKDGFDAMLRDYRDNSTWHFEEMDGTHRTWPELSPEGKLGYLARDAVLADAPPEHFVQAAREFLADLPPPDREEAALRLLLHSQRELCDVDRLLPSEDTGHDLMAPSRPLAERLAEFICDFAGDSQQHSVLGYKLPEPASSPGPEREQKHDRAR